MPARLADLKRGLALRLLPFDRQILDVGEARPAARPFDHRADPLVGPLEDGLDASVRCIPHPARETERASAVLHLRPKEDALDAAGDAHACANRRAAAHRRRWHSCRVQYGGFTWTPIERCNVERMVADLDDPGFMVAARMHDPEVTAGELISTRQGLARNGEHVNLVAANDEDVVCGWAALVPCVSEAGALETSTYLHPRVWGTPANLVCKTLLWTIGREILGRKVVMSINERNTRSLRANLVLFPDSPRHRLWEPSKNRHSINIEMDRPPVGFTALDARQRGELLRLLDSVLAFRRLSLGLRREERTGTGPSAPPPGPRGS
jgi:hypothetical protein